MARSGRPVNPKAKPPRRHPLPPAPRVPPHAFVADVDLGEDWQGRHCCRGCGKPGREGDEQHPVDAGPIVGSPPVLCPPVPEDDVSDRILGEGNDQGEGAE